MNSNFRCFKLFSALVLLVSSGLCTAAQILTSPEGLLTGARNVSVGGSLYDVTLEEGSCADIFSGCDEASDFSLHTLDRTEAAALALGDQILLDEFDAFPDRVFGCSDANRCLIIVPGMQDDGFLFAYLFTNFSDEEEVLGEEDVVAPGLVLLDMNTLDEIDIVYARFAPVQIDAPSPLSGLVLLGTFAALASRRRGQTAR